MFPPYFFQSQTIGLTMWERGNRLHFRCAKLHDPNKSKFLLLIFFFTLCLLQYRGHFVQPHQIPTLLQLNFYIHILHAKGNGYFLTCMLPNFSVSYPALSSILLGFQNVIHLILAFLSNIYSSGSFLIWAPEVVIWPPMSHINILCLHPLVFTR